MLFRKTVEYVKYKFIPIEKFCCTTFETYFLVKHTFYVTDPIDDFNIICNMVSLSGRAYPAEIQYCPFCGEKITLDK